MAEENNQTQSSNTTRGGTATEKSFDERQIVVFKIGDEEFGVIISDVREIIRMEKITKIPNSPESIEGVINLRGGIIVVVDLAKKLVLPRSEIDKDTRIIVIERDQNTVGMLVDSATEVLRLGGDKIHSAPSIITKKIDADYIEGVGILEGDGETKEQRLIILLDMVKVLDAKEIENVQKSPEIKNVAPTESSENKDNSELTNLIKSKDGGLKSQNNSSDGKKDGVTQEGSEEVDQEATGSDAIPPDSNSKKEMDTSVEVESKSSEKKKVAETKPVQKSVPAEVKKSISKPSTTKKTTVKSAKSKK